MLKSFLKNLIFGIYRVFLKKAVETLFHLDWYYNAPKLHFLGVGLIQNPMDLWVKQEIIEEIKPDVIVETGTHRGGTALFYSMLMQTLNPAGKVLTIDVEPRLEKARTYEVFQKFCVSLKGDSTSPEILSQVQKYTAGKKVLVVLDSLHRCEHVLREMELYGELVSPGSYLIVEDTNLGGHPVMPNYGPGPFEAIQKYLKKYPGRFEIDRSREKMHFCLHPCGYLKKIA